MKFFLNSLFGTFVAVLFLGFLELMLRLFLPFPLTTLGTYQSSNELVFFHTPNSTGYEVSPIDEHPPIYLHYNQYGFRGNWDEFPAGKKRVFVLGDSYIESRQVTLEKTMVELLNQAEPQNFFVNSGCSAFTPPLSYLLFQNRIAKLKPSKIVLFITFNDYSDNYTYGGGYYNQPSMLEGAPPNESFQPGAYKARTLSLRDRIVASSALWTYMDRLLSPPAMLNGDLAPKGEPKIHTDFIAVNKPDESFDEVERKVVDFTHLGIVKIAELSKKLNAEFYLFIIPMPTQVAASEWTISKNHFYGLPKDYFEEKHIYQDRLLKLCKEKSMNCTDLLPALQKAVNSEKKIFNPYDGHWTEYGNQIVANTVDAVLKASTK